LFVASAKSGWLGRSAGGARRRIGAAYCCTASDFSAGVTPTKSTKRRDCHLLLSLDALLQSLRMIAVQQAVPRQLSSIRSRDHGIADGNNFFEPSV
jgi:hypothetical protein